MTEPKLFVFTDVETTGLDVAHDYILEIAWQITDEKFEPLSEARAFILDHGSHWGTVFHQLRANDFVRQMHTDTGLTAELFRDEGSSRPVEISIRIHQDIEVAKRVPGYESAPVHLAGFSVGFDRDFLRFEEDFKGLFDEEFGVFHHRLLDLSSVKLLLDASGVPWEKAGNVKAHRAANDVQEAIEQARIFQRTLGALAVNI